MNSSSVAAVGAGASAFMNLIQLAAYVLQAWGLFMMAKALKVERPWLAWIPLVQIHTILQVAGKSWKWFLKFVITAIALFLLLPLSSFLAFATGIFALSVVGIISVVIAAIVLIVFSARLAYAIALRLGRGQWAAVGLFFLPVVAYPVYGHYALKKAQAATPAV